MVSTEKSKQRSACAVASSLDILGDKWSLLVVRDLLHGKSTYGELARSPERIPTNILAERLERLVGAGIVSSVPYQERPVRHTYTLTSKGRALGDVLLAFVRWGKQHIPGTVAMNQGPKAAEAAVANIKPRRKRPRE